MLLLAVDTSGKNGSLALARLAAGRSETDVLDVLPLAGGAFSAQLVPEMAALLKKHGYNQHDLGALIVASGPGSFTGLRVGLAAVKALAEALQKPIVAVSVLEAVACSAGRGRVLALLDAGRGDVYAGDYELDLQVGTNSGARVRRHSERLLRWEEFLAETRFPEAVSEPRHMAVVTPDAALAEKVRAAGIEVELIAYPNSGVLARLGWEHLQRGDTVGPEALEANYLRRSDAEIFSKPAR